MNKLGTASGTLKKDNVEEAEKPLGENNALRIDQGVNYRRDRQIWERMLESKDLQPTPITGSERAEERFVVGLSLLSHPSDHCTRSPVRFCSQKRILECRRRIESRRKRGSENKERWTMKLNEKTNEIRIHGIKLVPYRLAGFEL